MAGEIFLTKWQGMDQPETDDVFLLAFVLNLSVQRTQIIYVARLAANGILN